MTEEVITPESNGQVKNSTEENKEDETDLEAAIIRQIEYYFGDVNLPRDKFLREQVKLDDGWVPLEVLIKFNRLAKITTDLEVIAKALNKSTLGLVEVSEDNKKVRRNPEMPLPEMNEERRKDLLGRSIYAKGFAKEANLDNLLSYFKQYEEVENIVMRRYLDKNTRKRMFKGSIFATFKTKEQAVKFMETKDIKYEDTELVKLWQEEYLQQKQDEYASRKEQRDKRRGKDKTKEVNEKGEVKLPTGAVFHFTEASDKTSREQIKEALEALGGEVSYIDYQLGDKDGWVRLSKQDAAVELLKKATDGKLKVGETDIVARVLEGDEEKQYLEKTVSEMMKRRKNQKSFKHNNKGKNYKGKFGKKRKHDNHGDREGPPAKVSATS